MNEIRIYDYWRSSAAHRVRIGLNLKSIAYDLSPVNLSPGKDDQLRPAYRSKNPQARVPALELSGGVLTQSLAILEWLDEVYPDPPFVIGDAWLRASIRAFALTIACDIHPLNNISVLTRLRTQFGADDEAIAAWYRHWIAAGFEALEVQLGRRVPTPFTFGLHPTLADICLIPQMANARRFEVDLAPYPNLVRVDDQARRHPAFALAAPQKQEDPQSS
jgi:maleylpyruvate isomerase